MFPAVEVGIEGWHEFEVGGDAGEEEFIDLFEGGAVVGDAFLEGEVFEGEEVGIAEVFDEGDVVLRFIVEDGGDVEFGGFEELGDGDELRVVLAFVSPVDADEVGVDGCFDADDGSAGGTAFDGDHGDGGSRVDHEELAGCGEDGFGGHGRGSIG